MQNEQATTDCAFCPIKDTNVFLASVSSHYGDAWRNFGILWVYIIFNIFGAVFLYWLVRVPKVKKEKAEEILPREDARQGSVVGAEREGDPVEEVEEKAPSESSAPGIMPIRGGKDLGEKSDLP